MDNKDTRRIYVYLIIALVVVSFSSIFIKLSTAPPLIVAFYRMFISTLIITPYFIYKYRKHYRLLFDYRLILVGLLLALHFIFWITAFEYTSVANAVIFVALQPLYSIIFEYMFSREDLQKKTIIGVVLAMSGTIIISIGDINILFTRIWGDLLAFTAGLFAAFYLFIGRSLRKKLDYFPYIYVVYTYAALFIGICVLITGISFSGYNRINYLYFFILAIGPTLIGHSIFNYSVRFIPVSIVSLSLLAEPLLATILARLILGEVIVPVTVCGGVIILSGIYIATRQK